MVASVFASQQPAFRSQWFSVYENLLGVSYNQGQQVAIEPYRGIQRLGIWSQVKRGLWVRMRVDADDAALAMSKRLMHFIPTNAVIRAKDMTQTGAWNPYANTSSTGSNQRSVGNTSIGTSTAGRKISYNIAAPADGLPYDVYVAYTLRTAGGFCRPTIDNSQTLLDPSIVDPQGLGFRAINCYGPVDNTRRIIAKLADGLTGAHSIELECVAGVPTGSSAVTTGTVTIEAILFTVELDDARSRPQHWAPGLTILLGDECEYGGRYYGASSSGTTGASPPVHTAGSVSDGGVTWNAAGIDYYSGWINVRDVDYVSETESAIVALNYLAVNYDVGGQTHGNEYASNRSITIDGVTWPWTDASTIVFGSEILIEEDIAWIVPNAVGATVASGTRVSTYTPNKIANEKRVTAAVDFTIATAYGGMLPLVRWDGFWRANTSTVLTLSDGTDYLFDDYPTNTDQNLGTVLDAAVSGDMGIPGIVSMAISVDPASVNNYEHTGAGAFGSMNLNAIVPPPSAGTDWTAKIYFARAQATVENIVNGQELLFVNETRLGAS